MKLLTIPNKVTLVRVFLIPVFVAVFLSPLPRREWYSAVLFILISLSDIVDGYLARRRGEVSNTGKILDPVADKLLIIVALLLLVGRGVEWWMAMIIIIREALLTAIRVYLARRRVMVPADSLGKAKAVLQVVAISMTIPGLPFSHEMMIAAVALTVISGAFYLVKIRRATKNEVVNIPNGITLFRLLLIIPFFLFVRNSNPTWALVCFTAIVLMDRLDGTFARLARQKTRLGDMMDSATDWLLIVTTLVAGTVFGYIPLTSSVLLGIVAPVLFASRMLFIRVTKDTTSTTMGKLIVGGSYLLTFSYLISFPYSHILLWTVTVMSYSGVFYYLFKALLSRKKG